MTDRQLIRLALDTLTDHEFAVWITKHYAGKGRRTGSASLEISQDAWRNRLISADRKMTSALTRKEAAA